MRPPSAQRNRAWKRASRFLRPTCLLVASVSGDHAEAMEHAFTILKHDREWDGQAAQKFLLALFEAGRSTINHENVGCGVGVLL